MTLKRTAAILCIAALILTFTACAPSSDDEINPPTVSPAEDAPNTAGAGVSAGDPASPTAIPGTSVPSDSISGVHTASDENVMVNVEFDRNEFTVNDFIGMRVTIANTSDRDIVFLRGSGSNRVPDAVSVNFNDFINTYTPAVTTKDYQTETLKAGESISYDLPHAPYTYTAGPDGVVNPGGAYDAPIDYFQTGEYTAAEVGEKSGEITFRYLVVEDGMSAVPDFASENAKTVTVPFTTNIVA